MGASLYLTGSMLNGFGGSSRDLDLVVIPPPGTMRGSVQYLGDARRLLQETCGDYVKEKEFVPHTTVPLLILEDKTGQFEIKLTVNNTNAILNTHLLHACSQQDPRVRPLVVAVVHWARQRDINTPRHHTLSSYALDLMVIHFLQLEAVVPCLQKDHPAMFSGGNSVTSLDYDDIPTFHSNNKMTLGELFVGFFEYYNNFDFNADVISVRTGHILSREECQRYTYARRMGHRQWTANMMIEDPYRRNNVTTYVSNDWGQWRKIRAAFRDAATVINNNMNAKDQVTLDDIIES